MTKVTYAHTEGGNMYPRYINVVVDEKTGEVTFKVRGEPKDIVGTGYKHVGETGEITLSFLQALNLIISVVPSLRGYLNELSPTDPEALAIITGILQLSQRIEEGLGSDVESAI